MEIFFSIFLFLLGGVFASFLNVIILSSKSIRKNLKRKRSKCESCNKVLEWWELIPIFSWILLGGKCSKCKKEIPFYHIVSELVLGFVFLGLYNKYYSTPFLLILYLIVVLITYFFGLYDQKYEIVPNRWVYPTVGLTFVGIIVWSFFVNGQLEFLGDKVFAALGYSLFFGLMNLWSSSGFMPGVEKGKQGFGWGDAKFALFIGMILGITKTILSAWVAVFSGAFVGVIILLRDRPSAKQRASLRIPFIPFMTLGVWVALLWGDEIIDMVRSFYLY